MSRGSSVNRTAALITLTLGALVLIASATGMALALRREGGEFPLGQLLLALLVATGMSRALAVLRRERHAAPSA